MIPRPSKPQPRQNHVDLRIGPMPQLRQPASGHETFWFHCGHCGALFQSTAGPSDERLCAMCGFNPTPTTPSSADFESKLIPTETSGGKRPGKDKKRPLMLKLLSGWLLLIAIIVVGVRLLWHTEPPKKELPAANATPTFIDQDAELLPKAMPQCLDVLSGFLVSNTPEERNQFVYSPVSTASQINRFYTLNPAIKMAPGTLSLIGKSVLHLPGAKAIETHWKSKDGKEIDAVFREENGEWRLDWKQFVRYGDYPWSLFLAGAGPDEGEFRLLARERLAEERKNSESISLVFYAPRFGNPQDAGIPSPEFLIPRNTLDAQRIDAALRLARNGKRVFDAKLPDLNPSETIPVRVKAKRIETGLARRFEITSVTACHWYSLDDPGVEPLTPEPIAPAEIK